MTLIEMIQTYGEVPSKFEYPDGQKFETFIRKRIRHKGYIITVWKIVDGIQDYMVWDASGETVELAKENLKKKILK